MDDEVSTCSGHSLFELITLHVVLIVVGLIIIGSEGSQEFLIKPFYMTMQMSS